MDVRVKTLRCSRCDTPIASMQNGCIVIEARHHGEKHATVITIASLVEIAEKERRLVDLMEAGKRVLLEG